MNDQIEKMMLDATKDMPQGYYIPGEYFEKFAELIVLECAVIVGSMEEPHQDIAKLIKQHFGVEE